jgi:tetratricopeptide (TPR) repeat protein
VFFRRRLFVLLFITVAEIACQKKAAGPPPRYAVLRFENLSGDPSLDWTGRAASETLSVALAGAMDGPVLSSAALGRAAQILGPRPSSVPGVSGERQQALAAGANRLIAGYIERSGKQIRFAATEEDAASGKTLRIVSAVDSSPVAALMKIARQFSPNPKPPPASNEAALRLYATALESPIDASLADLEQATRIDPSFSEAWVGLANLEVAKGDRTAAAQTIDLARRQKLDALSLARLDLESANIASDQSARIEALREVALLSPGDILLLRSLAETEMATGHFAQAAADWKKVTAALPDDTAAWNSLGYTLSYAGDYNDALAALQEYARIRPTDPNAFDSIGDLHYSFRQFKEAADSYLQANKVQPEFQRYGDLYKAAWAKFNAGDKPGADALFAQFRAAREKMGDGLISLMAADWLYRTGRQSEALVTLRNTVAENKSEAIRANGYAQLTVWDLIGHDRAQAAKDSLAMGPKMVDTGMLIARFAAMPSAAASEWQSRADRFFPPSLAGLRPAALGYVLILDDKREAALMVWRQIVEKSSATDFFARAIYARLQGKPQERPVLPDPGNFNQFLALLYSL